MRKTWIDIQTFAAQDAEAGYVGLKMAEDPKCQDTFTFDSNQKLFYILKALVTIKEETNSFKRADISEVS